MPTYYKCGSCNKVVRTGMSHFCSDQDFDAYLFQRHPDANIGGKAERGPQREAERAPDNS